MISTFTISLLLKLICNWNQIVDTKTRQNRRFFNDPYDSSISGKNWYRLGKKVVDLGSKVGSKNNLSRLSFLKGYDFVLKSRASNLYQDSSNILEHSRTSPNILEFLFDPYGIRTLELITCSRYYDTFVNNKQNIDNSIFMRLLRLFSLWNRASGISFSPSRFSWLSIPTTWNKKIKKRLTGRLSKRRGWKKRLHIFLFLGLTNSPIHQGIQIVI